MFESGSALVGGRGLGFCYSFDVKFFLNDLAIIVRWMTDIYFERMKKSKIVDLLSLISIFLF